MGDHGFFLYLARLAAKVFAISRQGIEQLRSSIHYNFLLSPMKVAGDQVHRSQRKSTAYIVFSIHANSPGLSGSLPDTALIPHSPVWVTKSPR